MSHELESMAWAGEIPWHGLGKRVPHDLTPVQMLHEAGLDWRVEKVRGARPATIGKKRYTIASDKYDVIRVKDGVPMDLNAKGQIIPLCESVGTDWKAHQNDVAMDFFHDLVMKSQAEMHTAGSLRNGQVVWVLAKLKREFKIASSKDIVESYLLFANPHQYGKSASMRSTDIRVVCNNTFTQAISREAEVLRINHRQTFSEEKVREFLGLAQKKSENYEELAKFLASKRYTEETVKEYVQKVYPSTSKKTADKKSEKEMSAGAKLIWDCLEKQPGFDLSPGTWWSAFNATTFALDHLHGRSQDTRLDSAWFGGNKDRKIDALKLASDFANAA